MQKDYIGFRVTKVRWPGIIVDIHNVKWQAIYEWQVINS